MSHYLLPGAAGKRSLVFLVFFLFSSVIFSQRVISLAPGLTEIVFAIGRGNTLVGVTKFCDYPEAARNIPKIGGFLDVSVEALVALAPDIVIAYPEHAGRLKALPPRVRLVVVPHDHLDELLRSIREIGRVLDVEKEAARLVSEIQERLRRVALGVAGKRKIRTLCIAGRNADELKNMFIIGRNDFLNELLEIAGGTNAYRGAVDYPNISLESVIALDPEFIFEISSHYEGIADERILSLWRPLGMVRAVALEQVRIIKDPSWLRPGPRIGHVAEKLAVLLHGAGPRP